MIDPMRHALEKLLRQEDLTQEEAHAAVLEIMDGQSSEAEIAAFLTALRIKGEQTAEIAGAARAMRERATPIPTSASGILDTCGTGGSRLDVFNISTATAIVAAACGVPVAKHGNRSATSTSGSSDVLEVLGVDLTLSPEQVGECLDRIGICFCFAPLLHSAMKYAAPVRKKLGFRTVFNLLGPMTNPAGAQFQLLGTVSNELASKIAHALQLLGTERATVICGAEQLDEVSLWGETAAFRVGPGGVTEERWSAESFGLPECTVEDLRVESPQQSAQILRDVFDKHHGPVRDIVVANAAAALLTVGKVDSLQAGAAMAEECLDSRAAAEKLQQLVTTTQALKS